MTYDDVGGADESLEKLREVVELPLLHPERFVGLGIDPPKVRPTRFVGFRVQAVMATCGSRACAPTLAQGVLLYGPPGTGKTLSARAVANRTDATFIRVIGSELVQKCVPLQLPVATLSTASHVCAYEQVHRRGCTDGAGVVPDGTATKGVHHVLR